MIPFSKIAIAAGVLFLVSTSTGLSDDDHDRAKKLKEAGDILPLERIIEKAEAEHPGHILEAGLEEKKGRLIYELEILDHNGIVWELKFDARTGELLKQEQDDRR